MIKHIVMWTFKKTMSEEEKQNAYEQMKERLEALKQEIDFIEEIEVGKNFNSTEAAYDVVLYSVFKDRASLDAYQVHPKHVAVGQEVVRRVTENRVVVDYEM